MAKSKAKVKSEEFPEQAPETIPTILAPTHLLQLEVGEREIQKCKLAMAVEEQALRNMLLSQELLRLNIEKQKTVLASKSVEYDASKSRYSTLKVEIFEIYKLTEDKFGYNPHTGAILNT